MNASPSSHSVGSQKPSTAASTASKRTRTIIVARSLPEPNAAPPSTASSSPQGRPIAAHHGPRDPKPVKLASYAALGDEADLELYERFLYEQKTRSSDGTPLADGKSVPQFLRSSPKRRTTSQASLLGGGIEGPGGATTQQPVISPEDAADAKQRREAVVQHRKWLKSLPIHERLAYERRQNVIKKWKEINRQWEAFKQRTSKKLGKSEKQLVMSRASEYREQIEMYDALQRAMPLSEKVGGDIWLVSLRNEGTRYVPVGNIFSGLYCPIRESTKLQPRVRRPLDYLSEAKNEEGEPQATSQVMSAVEKRSLEALERKKRRLKKQLEALYPHEVEPSQSGQLKVDTLDLFEWASSGPADSEEIPHQTASTDSLLLPLEEGCQENNTDAMDSLRSTARSRQSSRRAGPSLHVFIADTSEEELHGTLPETVELAFFVDIAIAQQQTLCMENNGTTAIHFAWHREELVNEELTARLTQNDWNPLNKPTRTTWTSISQLQGVILPDEVLEFDFAFRSQRAGVWLEQWVLHTDLPLRGVKKGEPAARVRLHCTAVDNFVPITQRRKLKSRMAAAETEFMIEQLVKNDIVERVGSTYPVEFRDLGETARAFYDAHRGGEFDAVQYSERFLTQARELYSAALTVQPGSVISASSLEQDTENPETEHTNSAPEWDLNLVSLKNLAVSADAQLKAEYRALKAKQLAEREGQANGDEEEDDEEDLMEKILGTKARKKEEAQAALRSLVPHFLDDFNSLTLAAHVSPYEPRFLEATMAEKLASMAGETPVVYEIAQMLNANSRPEQATGLLCPLIVQAIDESLTLDRRREREFEDAKRKFHSLALAQKLDFRALPQLVPQSTHAVPLVIFLQVDLDIANWFALAPGSSGSLEWKLSQKLLDHDSQVPVKLTSAANSLLQVLDTLSGVAPAPTIVLLSELTTPPMTKAMKKMEMTAVRANARTVGGSDGATAPTLDAIEPMRQSLAQKRDKALSLRGVEVLLKRVLANDSSLNIEFVESLQSLEVSCKPSSRPATPSEDTDAGANVGEDTSQPDKPRIVVMEHLGTLSRQAMRRQRHSAGPDIPVAPSPATLPPVENGKPLAAATDKKKSAASAPATTTKQPSARSPPAADVTPEDVEDETAEVTPGMPLEMMGAQALGRRLGQLGNVLVADNLPQSWWESTFVFFTANPTPLSSELPPPTEASPPTETAKDPKHILVGPSLMKTFETWGHLFQRYPPDDSPSMKAVVGGRGLERKLRLIDGLLERVETIYFVGEIAMSIFRVLHTRQLMKSLQRERKPLPRFKSQRLIDAVERLTQKAYRKQVELLLPFDFIVGESDLERDGCVVAVDDEADDEDEEVLEEEEDDDDEEEEARKKPKKKLVCLKPLPEPAEVDTWLPRASYEGDRATMEFVGQSWLRFSDVTLATVANFNVIDGKENILESVEAENEETVEPTGPTTHPVPELDWTLRVLDVGPKSSQVMLDDLRMHRDECNGWVFVNGTLGAVEYREFETATRQLVGFLRDGDHESVLLTGKSTWRWFQMFKSGTAPGAANSTRLTMVQAVKTASALAMIVEARPHALITAFDSR